MESLEREPEVWKDIPGYEGLYQVSSWGNVKSCDRIVQHPIINLRCKKGVLLKPYLINTGYYHIDLYKNSKREKFAIHRLVYMVFYNDISIDFINHKDLNKLNNYYTNLENISNRENLCHAIDKTSTTSKFIGVSKSERKYNLKKNIVLRLKLMEVIFI